MAKIDNQSDISVSEPVINSVDCLLQQVSLDGALDPSLYVSSNESVKTVIKATSRASQFNSRKQLRVDDVDTANHLRDQTFNNVMQLMESSGNNILDDHKWALSLISEGLAYGALTNESFRWAYPLQTGMGKTSTVKGFVKAISDTDAPISLLIASEVIEQLKELKNDLLALGVPEAKLGIFHSSEGKYPDVPSVKKGETQNTQFLLVCHARLKNDAVPYNEALYYQGEKRNLVIWDESLITTSADFIAIKELIADCGAFIHSYEWMLTQGKRPIHNDGTHEELYEFIKATQDNLMNGINDETVTLPPLREINYDKIINAIHKCDSLKALVKFTQNGLIRKITTNEGPSFIQYYITVPDEIEKIVVLDASSEINRLIRYDQSIQLYNLDVNKDYSDCVIKFNKVQSSKSFISNKEGLHAYLNEVIEWIRNEVPETEEALIFCNADVFGMDVKSIISKAIYEIGAGYNHRVHVLTWGSHKGINKYRGIKYVYTFGLVHRDRRELAGTIIGQRRDMRHIVTTQEIHDVQRSLQADLIYQAVSRGNCRNTNNGKAGEMYIYLNHSDDGLFSPEYLGKLMPRVRIEKYESKFLKGGLVRYLEIAEWVIDFLDSVPHTVNRISLSRIAKGINYEGDTNGYTWRKAIKHVSSSGILWERSGRSFQRVFQHQ